MEITFYYDIVCPYAYVAFTQLDALEQRTGATVRLEPILLGGLYRSIGQPDHPGDDAAPEKKALQGRDLLRQAELAKVALSYHPSHPVRTVETMRLLTACPPAKRRALSADLYTAYWQRNEPMDRACLASIAQKHGIDIALIDDPEVKAGLRETTQRAADAGAFGVPTFVIDNAMYWGADRIDAVARAAGGTWPPPPSPTDGTVRQFEFFHDFSSPYSYVAACRVQQIAARTGTTVTWRPMLLGALFKSLGGPLVPLLEMPQVKQKHNLVDLQRAAQDANIPFEWTPHFPLRSVAALRVVLQEPAATLAVYAAAWEHGKNISDPDVLAAVLDRAGFDGATLIAGTQDPEIKAQLRKNTEDALAYGACGAPTFVVDGSMVFWGNDRLGMVEAALGGWKPQAG